MRCTQTGASGEGMNEAGAGIAELEEGWHSPKGRAVREVVFGMHDGLITTIGFLSGVNAASASLRVIVIAGLAEAFAQTLSMGFGAYGAGKTFLTGKVWWRSRLETMGIGLLVSVAGYGIGHFLGALWP